MLGHHGMSSWANNDKTCYETALEIIDTAARYIEAKDKGEQTFGGQKHQALPAAERQKILVDLLPWLRGQLSSNKAHGGNGAGRSENAALCEQRRRRRALQNSARRVLITFCARRSNRCSLNWNPASGDLEALQTLIETGLVQYRKDYAAYYDRCKHPDSPAMRDANPTVVLIPGIGMIALGKNKSESRVTAEFYNCAIEVMRGAEAIDEYEAMDRAGSLRHRILVARRSEAATNAAEKELDRQVIAVIGAGAGIGKATAHRLVKEGAHIVCVDLDEASPHKETAKKSSPNMAQASALQVPASAIAARRLVWRATSQIVPACKKCLQMRCLRTAELMRSS